MAGWLDQSFWPDGIYTAPTDDALRFDLESILTFGMNAVRLHQKVNSERWYYWADKLGIIVIQDMIQKYGGATSETVDPFMSDLKYLHHLKIVLKCRKMIEGKYNHPSIVQWTVFNEGDCWGVFNVTYVVEQVQKWDSSRLVDTDRYFYL